MATISPPLAPRRTLSLLPAIFKLAWWRFKRMWHVLLVTWLGMLTMVILVCAVPLFSQVAMTAGVRNALNSAPPPEQRLTFTLASSHPTSTQISQAGQGIAQVLHDNLASYTSGAPHFSVQVPALTIASGGTTVPGQNSSHLLGITSYTMKQVANEITVAQGRLPQAASNMIEIALTSNTAHSLGVHVGSLITANLAQSIGGGSWTLRVVGIFSVNTNWESPNNFQAMDGDSGTIYPALASNEAILPKIAPLQVQLTLQGKRVFTVGGAAVPFFLLSWSYPFDSSQVTASNADTLSSLANTVQSDVADKLSNLPGTFFTPRASGVLFDVLPQYYGRIFAGEIVVSASLILILGLVLFLVSMMTAAMIERQAAVIATLRSRGATRRHVFGAFAAQGVVLGLTALLIGPFVAIALIRLIVQLLFPSGEQSAISVLTGNPLQAALSAGWFALASVAIAILVVIVAIRRASAMDILAFRREAARATRPPLWRRLHLDLFLALLVCIGYAAYAYLTQPFFSFNSGVKIILGLLALVAPLLILAAGITLFLRIFPLLLRLGTRLAMRGRGTSAVLAYAQMERAPRPASRMVLLLALGTAFALFMLTSIATQQQRVPDGAAYQVYGADFSGPIESPSQGQTLAQLMAAYQHTTGVTSATVGYKVLIPIDEGRLINDIVAVDANTFAHTASWSPLHSDSSLSSLMALLVAHRADAAAHDVVYAIVDDTMWKSMNLSIGSSFILPTFDGFNTHFIVAGRVHTIPGVYDGPGNYGMLVDYSSYATAYTKDSGGGTLAPNYVWLQTHGDAASLSNVRKTYPVLDDRRAILASLQADPLHIDLLSLLGAGVATALLLALVGTLFAAWLNASGRLTGFAILRALGMVPRKIAAVLLWELGSICAAALALGIGLGFLLIQLIMPVLDITDFIGGISPGTPVQLVIPTLRLAFVLGAILCICIVALALMARLVSRPSLSQTLRLNED